MNCKLYGIPNCNTVKKARDFLDKKKIQYEFSDFKKTKPTVSEIKKWKEAFGELPVNKQGLTYRKYKEQYEELTANDKIKFLCDQPSMIKRPILEIDGNILAFGFDITKYEQAIRA